VAGIVVRKVLGRIAGNTVASRPKQGIPSPVASCLGRILSYRSSEVQIDRQSGLDDHIDSDVLLLTCTTDLVNGQRSRLIWWSVLKLNSLAGAFE